MLEHDYKNILIKSPETVPQRWYIPTLICPPSTLAILATPPLPYDFWIIHILPPDILDVPTSYKYIFRICSGTPTTEREYNVGEELFFHSGPNLIDYPVLGSPFVKFRCGPYPAGSSVAIAVYNTSDTDTYNFKFAVLIELTKLTP